MRVLHFADAHFEKDKIEKCRASAEFIVGQAQALKPDLIVNAGDTFNRLQSLNDKSAISTAKSFIMSLAEISPVVIIKGNESHDSRGCLEIFGELKTKHPIFRTEGCGSVGFSEKFGWFEPITVTGEDRFKFILHLFSYPEKAWFLRDKPNASIEESNRLIQDAIKKIFTGFGAISMDAKCPVILVGHGNIVGARLCSGQDLLSQDIMLSKHDLMQARDDVQCWGHIHECQEIAPHIWYSGSIYHNNWGEVTSRFVLLHEIERGSCQTTRVPIPSRPLSLHQLNWDEESGPEPGFWDPEDHCDWNGADLRIRVNATKEKQLLITDEEIKTRYERAATYQIERIVTPEERIRSSEIVKAKTLPEKVTEWGRSIDKEISPEVLSLAGEVERSVIS
jgi:DNA repair exonuclease SbcCD nuclease subunit